MGEEKRPFEKWAEARRGCGCGCGGGVGVGVGVGVVSGVSGGTRSGGDEQTQIQNTFQGREHFTAIEGQGLHDTGSGCESRGLEREQLEDRIDGLQLGGG